MDHSFEIALLAPVPQEHLESGRDVCEDIKKNKVAFGSNAWQLFEQLDAFRSALKVRVYIYASHTKDPIGNVVSWQAFYIGHQRSEDLPASYAKLYRPPSTEKYADDTLASWAVFWEVTDLKPLATPIPISTFTGYKQKKSYVKNFIPEGPLIISYPYI